MRFLVPERLFLVSERFFWFLMGFPWTLDLFIDTKHSQKVNEQSLSKILNLSNYLVNGIHSRFLQSINHGV